MHEFDGTMTGSTNRWAYGWMGGITDGWLIGWRNGA